MRILLTFLCAALVTVRSDSAQAGIKRQVQIDATTGAAGVDTRVEDQEVISEFVIEHSVNGVDFSLRSKAQIVKKADGRQGLKFLERNGVFGESVVALKKLLRANDLYKIRIRSSNGPPILSSIPACELQQSGFKEDIIAYLDVGGSIIGVSYSSPVMALSRECDPTKVPDAGVNFQTRIKLGETLRAQSIPLQATGPRPSSLENVKLGTAEDQQAQQPQQQSFLRKYWYIVVAMILYLLLGGSGGEPPKAEGDTAQPPKTQQQQPQQQQATSTGGRRSAPTAPAT